jgi:RimJ/RimL family protein N-acetyltransferase
MISDHEHGRPCGSIGLVPCDDWLAQDRRLKGLLRPVVYLDPGARRKGYAQESLQTVLAFAFDALDQHAIGATHHADSDRGARLIRRAGFRSLGALHARCASVRTYVLTHHEWRCQVEGHSVAT